MPLASQRFFGGRIPPQPSVHRRLLTFGAFGRSASEWSTCSLLCCRGNPPKEAGWNMQGFPEDEMEHGRLFFWMPGLPLYCVFRYWCDYWWIGWWKCWGFVGCCVGSHCLFFGFLHDRPQKIQGCRCVPYTCSETTPKMVPYMDLNIYWFPGFGLAWFQAIALRVGGERLELSAPLIAVLDTGTTGRSCCWGRWFFPRNLETPVDGQNPARPSMMIIPLVIEF